MTASCDGNGFSPAGICTGTPHMLYSLPPPSAMVCVARRVAWGAPQILRRVGAEIGPPSPPYTPFPAATPKTLACKHCKAQKVHSRQAQWEARTPFRVASQGGLWGKAGPCAWQPLRRLLVVAGALAVRQLRTAQASGLHAHRRVERRVLSHTATPAETPHPWARLSRPASQVWSPLTCPHARHHPRQGCRHPPPRPPRQP